MGILQWRPDSWAGRKGRSLFFAGWKYAIFMHCPINKMQEKD